MSTSPVGTGPHRTGNPAAVRGHVSLRSSSVRTEGLGGGRLSLSVTSTRCDVPVSVRRLHDRRRHVLRGMDKDCPDVDASVDFRVDGRCRGGLTGRPRTLGGTDWFKGGGSTVGDRK